MKILKNNLYILRFIWNACPLRVVLSIFNAALMYIQWSVYTIFVMRFIVGALEKGTPFQTVLLFLAGLFLFSAFCIGFSSWFEQFYVPKTNVTIQKSLIAQIYDQAVKVDLSCYENPEFYDKYTRANKEVLTRGIQVLDTVSILAGLLLNTVLCVCLIAYWEPIILPIVIIGGIIANLFDRKANRLRFQCQVETTPQRRQTEYVRRTVYLQDFAKELRLGNIFFPLSQHFNQSVREMLKINKHYYSITAWLRFVREIFMSFGVFLAAQGLIIYRYLTYHAYSLSDVVTVLSAANNLQSSIYEFSWNFSTFIENALYADNIREFLEYEPKIIDDPSAKKPPEGQNTLSLKNVSFTYDGQAHPVLKNITMDLPPKIKIALVGHNGAGKSTLVKLLMRLYDVTEGEILFGGTNIKKLRLNEYRKKFSTIFQDFKIFAASVTENVLLHPPQNEQDLALAENALKSSGLYQKIISGKHGLDTMLTKEFDPDGTLMSGGEFQKLAIARVFAKECPIAILDEPSSALDPISEYEMFDNMMRACADKTVIFISHRLSSAVMADKIYLLEQGEIVEEGSHQELMALNGRYAQMFLMQSEKYQEGGDEQ